MWGIAALDDDVQAFRGSGFSRDDDEARSTSSSIRGGRMRFGHGSESGRTDCGAGSVCLEERNEVAPPRQQSLLKPLSNKYDEAPHPPPLTLHEQYHQPPSPSNYQPRQPQHCNWGSASASGHSSGAQTPRQQQQQQQQATKSQESDLQQQPSDDWLQHDDLLCEAQPDCRRPEKAPPLPPSKYMDYAHQPPSPHRRHQLPPMPPQLPSKKANNPEGGFFTQHPRPQAQQQQQLQQSNLEEFTPPTDSIPEQVPPSSDSSGSKRRNSRTSEIEERIKMSL